MEWNDNVLEEDHMLISQRHSKATDNACKNVEKLSRTIELMILMDKCEEAFVNGLSNHLSPRNQFSIQLVKNILEIISFN